MPKDRLVIMATWQHNETGRPWLFFNDAVTNLMENDNLRKEDWRDKLNKMGARMRETLEIPF